MSGFRIRKLEGTPLYAIGAGYYSPKLNAAARTVPGVRLEPKLKYHFVGYPDAIEQLVARLRELGLNTDDPPQLDRSWRHNLLVSYESARDYQKTGIDFLVANAGSGALLADDMGCIAGDENVTALYVTYTADGHTARRIETVSLRNLHDRFRLSWYTRPKIWALCGDKFDFHDVADVVDQGVRDTIWLEFHTASPNASCRASSLRLTPDHEVATLSGFRRADSLQPGDTILEDGHDEVLEAHVTAIRNAGPTRVYDVVCKDPHRNFVANGIVVHNCGKSFQAIKAARAFRRKTVVVCPSHVRGVWERPKDRSIGEKGGELAQWWPDAKVFRPYGVTPEKIPADADVVVIHYDIIYAWVEVIIAWGRRRLTFILDEAHACMDPESRRSLACQEIRAASLGTIALTGTPPTDKIEDLFGLLQVISPGRFGEKFFGYGLRYCDGHEIQIEGPDKIPKKVWDWKGRSNVAELRQRLDWFTLRRTKREVMAELPKMTRQIVDVEVPAKTRIAMNARIVGDKRQMRAALDSAADGKLKSVLELVRGHLSDGLRVVVATYRRAMCEKIADIIGETADVPTRFIHGGLSRVKRDKIVAEMRKVEGPCCLVTNIDVTATGINLTFASVGVVAELVWEPKDHLQWESRTHRFGQEEPVLIQYVIARGTGDELVLQAVINKLDNFLELVETDAGDGFKESLVGKKDEGLTRLAAALKKMGEKSTA